MEGYMAQIWVEGSAHPWLAGQWKADGQWVSFTEWNEDIPEEKLRRVHIPISRVRVIIRCDEEDMLKDTLPQITA